MRAYFTVLIFFILILGTRSSHAQVTIINYSAPGSPNILASDHPISYKDVEGSPYLFDEFKYGVVYYGGKYKLEQIPLRLNLYKDQLEYKKAEMAMVFANPVRLDSIIIGDEVFIYLQKRRNYKVAGFVKLLNSNTPTLLCKMKIAFIKSGVSTSHYQQSKANRFERLEDKYFIKNRYDEIVKITTVKKLIKTLGNFRTELTEYSQREGVVINNEEHLVKLIDYYHQLEQH